MYPIKKVDKGFYRSPRPSKEQLAQWRLIFNIGAVLMLDGDNPDDAAVERENCNQIGIDASYMRWSGFYRPTVNALIEGVDFIVANQKAGIKILTH